MKIIHILGCIGILFLGSSCATKRLWQGHGFNTRAWISADDITERELIDKGIEYEHYYSETGPGYLVKRNAMKDLPGFIFRAFATPVTLVFELTPVTDVFTLTPTAELELLTPTAELELLAPTAELLVVAPTVELFVLVPTVLKL